MRKRILGPRKSATSRSTKISSAAELGTPSSQSSSRHFVYILECADSSLYTGYTTNPARRLAEHNRGTASRYTRTRRPVRLVFLQELDGRGEALSRELSVKKMRKSEKLLLCQAYLASEKHGSR